ncbi:MAG: hypothetical protein ABJA81_08415 [Nocardioidaceae bacterium]
MAMTFVVVPAGTSTPQEFPAGTLSRWRRTSYPWLEKRRSTQAAALRYDAELASRGPIAPAKNLTVLIARSGVNASGCRDGVTVVGLAGTVDVVRGDGVARVGVSSLDRSSGGAFVESAVQPASVIAVSAVTSHRLPAVPTCVSL